KAKFQVSNPNDDSDETIFILNGQNSCYTFKVFDIGVLRGNDSRLHKKKVHWPNAFRNRRDDTNG
ncbi:Uncharacterized protein APZ42_000479, partial [Daphnia magna]